MASVAATSGIIVATIVDNYGIYFAAGYAYNCEVFGYFVPINVVKVFVKDVFDCFNTFGGFKESVYCVGNIALGKCCCTCTYTTVTH